jgi:uncharacterized repeat protein (TIGR01451 family)
MNAKLWRVGLVAALVAGAPAMRVAAQQGEPEALVITARNLMAGDQQHRALADSTALLPGDVVEYRLVFTNRNTAAVRDIELKDPIPAGLRYMLGSAKADRDDAVIEFSIDGGATYSAHPMVEVMVDGKPEQRPAPVQRYTHVRWTVQGWVQPGAQVAALFQARLPGPEPRPDTTAASR